VSFVRDRPLGLTVLPICTLIRAASGFSGTSRLESVFVDSTEKFRVLNEEFVLIIEETESSHRSHPSCVVDAKGNILPPHD
jgi:hypothetical protein